MCCSYELYFVQKHRFQTSGFNFAQEKAASIFTRTILRYLRQRLPQQYNLAEVVGKWVSLHVSPARKPALAKMLWTLGFHRNQRRGVWQHPCGNFDPLGSHPTDPR